MGRRMAAAAAAALALLAAGCAPKEAAYELSERATEVPAPTLLPTADFEASQAEGVAGVGTLDAERGALEDRAAALRGRAAALSALEPIPPQDRARLQAARPSD